MKYGAHSLMWTSAFSEKDLDLFDKLKGMGFDGIEIKLSDLSILPVSKIEKKMTQTDMKCTFSLALDSQRNIISPDKEKRKEGVKFLKQRIEVASYLGSDVIGGPFYGAWGEFTGQMRTKDEWNYCKEHLSEVAEFAKEKGVVLAVEPLNRYETYFLNTAQDARKLVEEINHPNLNILLDTYHMNIEDDDMYESIRLAAGFCWFVHFADNNRKWPGRGHLAPRGALRHLRRDLREDPV